MTIGNTVFLILSALTIILFEACNSKDILEPAIPPSDPFVIKYVDHSFRNVEGLDTMKLTMSIKHKYEMGLSPFNDADLEVPFHHYDYVVDANGDSVTKEGEFLPPFFRLSPNGEKTFLSAEDERPSELQYCPRYYYYYEGDKRYYVRDNLYFTNLHIKFSKKNAGLKDPFDGSCADFNARIPPLSAIKPGFSIDYFQFEFKVINQYEYQLTYNMISLGFPVLLANDTFAIEFFVIDKMLNISDTIRTPFNTLKELEG